MEDESWFFLPLSVLNILSFLSKVLSLQHHSKLFILIDNALT